MIFEVSLPCQNIFVNSVGLQWLVKTCLLHAEASFRNLIKSKRNQIVFSIFRLIWNQTEVRLVPNPSVRGKYNLISVWYNKISKRFFCVYYVKHCKHISVLSSLINFEHNFIKYYLHLKTWIEYLFTKYILQIDITEIISCEQEIKHISTTIKMWTLDGSRTKK